jgi:hypothetical protein
MVVRRNRARSISLRTADSTPNSSDTWIGDPVPVPINGLSTAATRSETTLTMVGRGCDAAGAEVAEAAPAENVVANVVTASAKASAEESFVGVSSTASVFDVCDSDRVDCPTAAVTDDLSSPETSEGTDARRSCRLAEPLTVTSSFADAVSADGVSSSPVAGGVSSSTPLVGSSAASPSSASSPSPMVSSSVDLSVSTVDPSDEADGDSRSEADELLPSDASVDAASLPAEVAVFDEGVAVDEDVLVDEDLLVDEESPVVDEESLVDDAEPDGSAYAMAGVLAMATPTPRVTANAPTRPMYLE